MLLQLDDLRDAAEIETGWWVPETRSFDLHRVIDGAIAAIRPYAADLGINPIVRVDPRIPYELRGWSRQLRQILVSLACATIIRCGVGRLRVAVDLVLQAEEFHKRKMAVAPLLNVAREVRSTMLSAQSAIIAKTH